MSACADWAAVCLPVCLFVWHLPRRFLCASFCMQHFPSEPFVFFCFLAASLPHCLPDCLAGWLYNFTQHPDCSLGKLKNVTGCAGCSSVSDSQFALENWVEIYALVAVATHKVWGKQLRIGCPRWHPFFILLRRAVRGRFMAKSFWAMHFRLISKLYFRPNLWPNSLEAHPASVEELKNPSWPNFAFGLAISNCLSGPYNINFGFRATRNFAAVQIYGNFCGKIKSVLIDIN